MIPTEIVIHASATDDTAGFNAAAIKAYHTKTLNWLDVGYHALIEYVSWDYFWVGGRPWHWAGAHTIGHNSKALGLCFVGDFRTIAPPDAMLAKGAEVVRLWLRFYPIPFSSIYRHCDLNDTECPGKAFPFDRFLKLCGKAA
jgi:N-acetylmuramoyl-L-alanine amidase